MSADLAASIAAALAATDTAARALWEAMGSPGYYDGAKCSRTRIVVSYFRHANVCWGRIAMGDDGAVSVEFYADPTSVPPTFEHHGSLDSARAALAAYLGAS